MAYLQNIYSFTNKKEHPDWSRRQILYYMYREWSDTNKSAPICVLQKAAREYRYEQFRAFNAKSILKEISEMHHSFINVDMCQFNTFTNYVQKQMKVIMKTQPRKRKLHALSVTYCNTTQKYIFEEFQLRSRHTLMKTEYELAPDYDSLEESDMEYFEPTLAEDMNEKDKRNLNRLFELSDPEFYKCVIDEYNIRILQSSTKQHNVDNIAAYEMIWTTLLIKFGMDIFASDNDLESVFQDIMPTKNTVMDKQKYEIHNDHVYMLIAKCGYNENMTIPFPWSDQDTLQTIYNTWIQK